MKNKTFLMEAEELLIAEEGRIRKERNLKENTSCVKYFSEPYAYLALQVSNLTKNKNVQRECIGILANSKALSKAITFHVNRKYGYYGCEKLNFIYENVDKDEFLSYIWEKLEKYLKTFNGDFFPRTSEGNLDLSQTAFEKSFIGSISKEINWSYKEFLVDRCKEYGMEGMKMNHLSDYAIIRKVCNYEVDLDSNSNEEIIACFENHWETNTTADKKHKRSMGSKDISNTLLNRLRRGFSFTSVSDASVDMEESVINRELLKDSFNCLNDREKQIIYYRYLTDDKKMSFSNIGNLIGLKEDQVRYIHNVALATLRKEFSLS